MTTTDELFEAHRGLLFGIAYRMVGSAMEAEDLVQDAYLRFRAVPPETVQFPRAYLSKLVTRLCLDHLKSAQARREVYPGTWLPEPLPLADAGGSPMERETISLAFLVLLERLTPAERAVFLLREVFDYDYAEIASIVGRDEAACRQLLHRARQHVAAHRPRFDAAPEAHQRLLLRFLAAVGEGDLNGLTALLAEDVVSTSDGGGRVAAALHPVVGRDHVGRFLMGLGRRGVRLATTVPVSADVQMINGQHALVLRVDGRVDTVLTLEVGADGLIHAVRLMRNPDKLRLLR